MDLNTVVPIGLKPTVRTLSWEEYRQFAPPDSGDCIVSMYFCEAEVQKMNRLRDGEIVWSGAWAWLSEQEAMNCARAESFKDGITAGRNLFYRIDDSTKNLRRALTDTPEADPSSHPIDPVIERHVEQGNNCLIATFDPLDGKLSQFRIQGHYLRWWHIGGPMTRESARNEITRTMEEHKISPENLDYIETLQPKVVV